MRHNQHERWCIEKICHRISDIENGPQVIQNGNVWISCSSYIKHVTIDNIKQLFNLYNLQNILMHVLWSDNNGYGIFLDNCKIFKEKLWDYLSNSLI